MSQTDQGHWREPPKDRVDPAYPVHLTERYSAVEINDVTIVYDSKNTGERWLQGEGIEREAMV